MKIQPLKEITKPTYPQKVDVSATDLKTSIPKRWITCSAAKVALGTLAVMSLVGCNANGDKMPNTTSTKQTAEVVTTQPTQLIDDYASEGEVMVPMISVAPIFVHGGGRGAFGCVMIAPPVFLTEDEALDVINEVASEYGLVFSANDSLQFGGVVEPITRMYSNAEGTDTEPQNEIITLTTDFSDNEHGIAIEYVSVNDVKKWNVAKPGMSAGSYDTKDAAEQLVQGLEFAMTDSYDDYAAGVLYDPCINTDMSDTELTFNPTEEQKAIAMDVSVWELKQQVKDFFEWLKGEGII